LLAALGILCLHSQLWGQAERYLLRSLSFRDDVQPHALLGSLYDRLHRSADALRHWRLATAVSMPLPVLATEAILPPADMQADPYRGQITRDSGADAGFNRAGSTLRGFFKRKRNAVPTSTISAAVDIEDYFDSAPIPAAVFEAPVHTEMPTTQQTPAPAVLVPTKAPPVTPSATLPPKHDNDAL
jgi:HemY protein